MNLYNKEAIDKMFQEHISASWGHINGNLDSQTDLKTRLQGKLPFSTYYGAMIELDDDNLNILYNNNDKYILIERSQDRYVSDVKATSTDNTYQEGPIASRPNPESINICICYYATDENKYYIKLSTNLLTYYWKEISMNELTRVPTKSDAAGWYKSTVDSVISIYEVYYKYSKITLNDIPNKLDKTSDIQKIEKVTELPTTTDPTTLYVIVEGTS